MRIRGSFGYDLEELPSYDLFHEAFKIICDSSQRDYALSSRIRKLENENEDLSMKFSAYKRKMSNRMNENKRKKQRRENN